MFLFRCPKPKAVKYVALEEYVRHTNTYFPMISDVFRNMMHQKLLRNLKYSRKNMK